jgi:hypothetical protein
MALFRFEVRAQVLKQEGVLSREGEELPDAESFAEMNERVMEQLIQLGAVDPFVYAEGGEERVEFSVTIEADTELDAIRDGYGLVSTAIHAAGRRTPGWERLLRNLKPAAELQSA